MPKINNIFIAIGYNEYAQNVCMNAAINNTYASNFITPLSGKLLASLLFLNQGYYFAVLIQPIPINRCHQSGDCDQFAAKKNKKRNKNDDVFGEQIISNMYASSNPVNGIVPLTREGGGVAESGEKYSFLTLLC